MIRILKLLEHLFNICFKNNYLKYVIKTRERLTFNMKGNNIGSSLVINHQLIKSRSKNKNSKFT